MNCGVKFYDTFLFISPCNVGACARNNEFKPLPHTTGISVHFLAMCKQTTSITVVLRICVYSPVIQIKKKGLTI